MQINKQTKEVFVFGAGASKDSGRTPLGKDLIWNYHSSCCTMPVIGADGRPDLTEEEIEFANLSKFFDLVEETYPELKGEKQRWNRQMQDNVMYSPPSNLDKKYYVDEMVRILQDRDNRGGIELIRGLTLEHIGGSSFASGNKLYLEFVKRLNGKSSEQASVISFNFDCLLQEDFKNGIYFDYLMGFDLIHGNRISYNKQNGIPLIKLNGSLDWAICQRCSKVLLLYPHITKNSYDNLYCCMSEGCQGRLEPLIFLPHEEKGERIRELWDKAKLELKSASKITVIGYSFPYYDTDVINLFREHTNPEAVVEIIDYEVNVDRIPYDSNFTC